MGLKRKALALVMISLFGAAAHAEGVSDPGNLTGFGSSARTSGMGGAFSAVADDPSALIYNPAGLSQLFKTQLNAFYSPLFLNTRCGAVEFAHPTRKFGVLGFGWIKLASGGFEARRGPEDDPAIFDVSDQIGIIGYSYRLGKFLSVGLNAKYRRKEVYNDSADSFGADAAVMVKNFSEEEKAVVYPENFFIRHLKKMSFGAVFQDAVATKSRLKNLDEKYPMVRRWGVSYLAARKDGRAVILSYDLEDSLYPDKTHHVGAEYFLNKMISLRTGYQNDALSLGFGVRYDNYLLDYSLSAHDLGVIQKFSLGMRFGHTMEELQEIRRTNIEKMTRKQAKLLSSQYYTQGMDQYAAKKYKEALKSWEKAVIWDPENYKADEMADKTKNLLEELELKNEKENHLLLAHALFSQGKYTQSLEEWEWIKKKDPSDKTADEYISRIKNRIAISIDERRKFEEETKARNEGRIALLTDQGWSHFKQSDYKKAIEVWQDIFNIDYDHQKTLENITLARKQMNEDIEKEMGLGLSLFREKKYVESIPHFKNLLKLDPDNAVAAKSIETAKRELSLRRQSDPIDPKYIDRLYFMAADHYLEGEYLKAKEVINQIKALDPLNENAVKLEARIDDISVKIKRNGNGR